MTLLPLLAAGAVLAVVVPVSLVTRHADPPAAPAPQLWTGTATLLQTPDGVLTLCGGAILESLPPAGCGGARVHGLDPMTVEGAVRYPNGTVTTSSVRLVGTWDGSALTPTRPPEPAERPAGQPPLDVPGPSCPEPGGGWPFDRTDRAGWDRVQAYAHGQPDAGTPRVDDSQRILTVPFTGDLDRHRAAIARLYDGPVCVERVARSARDLRAVFDRAQDDLALRGLIMLSGGGGGSSRPYAQVDVVAATPAEQRELEAAYDGLLRVDSFLVPLAGEDSGSGGAPSG